MSFRTKRRKNSRRASDPCSEQRFRPTREKSKGRCVGLRMTAARNQGSPCIELKRSLRSEVAAISLLVDKLMRLVRKCGRVPERDSDVEMALREALANAVIHGNQENT